MLFVFIKVENTQSGQSSPAKMKLFYGEMNPSFKRHSNTKVNKLASPPKKISFRVIEMLRDLCSYAVCRERNPGKVSGPVNGYVFACSLEALVEFVFAESCCAMNAHASDSGILSTE